MPANTQISGTPTASPNTLSMSSPQDVWFEWSLYNSGDEDDTTTGWYYMITDPDGTWIDSQFAPDDTLVAGQANQQGGRIDGSTFNREGTWWVMLKAPSGDSVGGATVEVGP